MVTLASSLVGDSVRTASSGLLGPAVRAEAISILGVDALCFYHLDKSEHLRRGRTHAATLSHMADLETLLALPLGVPVPLASLTASVRRGVSLLPAGAVERDRKTVTRRAVPPLRVELAVVRASNWRRGLELAGRFAPYCRRAFLLDQAPSTLEEALVEADFYGVGVLLASEGRAGLVLEPEQYLPPRRTAAAWLFVEDMYQRLLSASAV
jgi:hypothetical protein